MTIEGFFQDEARSRQLFEVVRSRIEATGPAEMRVTKSQVGFYRRRPFAVAWMPARYLRHKAAPLVLTIYLRHRDPSPRWKEVVEPYPGRFSHHLELYAASDIDDEVSTWLQAAWSEAGE